MKRIGLWKAGIIGLACLGMIIPAPVLHAAAVADDSKREADGRVPAAVDVALREGGALLGQVVDAQGKPLPRAAVRLWERDREVAATLSGSSGYFLVNGLHGGTYRVGVGKANGLFRLWAPDTAPPSAQPGALIVVGGKQVLGQNGPLAYMLSNPWIVAGLVATAIAVPVVIYNDQVDRHSAPASP